MGDTVREGRHAAVLVDLDRLREARARHGPALWGDSVEGAVARITRLVARIERGRAAGDMAAIESARAALRDEAAALGLRRLEQVCADLADVMERGDRPAIHAVASRIARLGPETLVLLVSIADAGLPPGAG